MEKDEGEEQGERRERKGREGREWKEGERRGGKRREESRVTHSRHFIYYKSKSQPPCSV